MANKLVIKQVYTIGNNNYINDNMISNNNNDNGDSTNDVWDSWPLCEYPACPDPVRKPAGTLEAVWTYMYLKEAALVKKRGLFGEGKPL